MDFYCVYCKNRKKFDKYVKKNNISNKYIIDIKKMMDGSEDDEVLDIDNDCDKKYLTLLVYKKINKAIEKDKNIYYLPNFNIDFSITKLMSLKKILGYNNNFNIIIFYNDFKYDKTDIMTDAINNLSNFSNSQIIKDF